ncbi:MAG: hypothetical protein JSV78_06765 [Phycisphaerales bacterium]|nr:MAG: hypothetical protein JSV78_06765 [Phycisphaerales bacterium]
MKPCESIPVAEHALLPLADLKNELENYEPVNLCPGPEQNAFVVASRKCRDYQRLNRDFRVIEAGPDYVVRHEFPERAADFHYAQPLPTGGMVLVSGRCRQGEKNAWLLGHEGHCIDQLCLGDGIEDVQVTKRGDIWTSYFDQGVLADSGLDHGASGLVCWNMTGEKIWEFRPKDGLDIICDCYALNVVSEREVWFYYYTQFPLVRLTEGGELAWWTCPVHGAKVFAILGEWALFAHGYVRKPEFTLLHLRGEREMVPQTRIRLLDDRGEATDDVLSSARGSVLFFLRDGTLYSVDIRRFIP